MTETSATTPTAREVWLQPGDAEYGRRVRGYNNRWIASPATVVAARDVDDVVDAVAMALRTGRRIAVRSGGHCFEAFATSPDIDVLVDLSGLDEVRWDAGRGAFAVGAGATLERVYRALHDSWGVTIPGGTCFEVGMGGHVTGGGYGPLSRRDGLVVDHLEAVEVVVVDDAGQVGTIVAGRDPADPHHDLWWAHTGAGGGNFGVVTRFWLRTPDADPTDPFHALPRAPRRVLRRDVAWSWSELDEESFAAIVDQFCRWLEDHQDPADRTRELWSNLIVTHRASGGFGMTAVVDADVVDADVMLDEHVSAVTAGVPVSSDRTTELDWSDEWLPSYSWPSHPEGRYKNKAGYLRVAFSREQIATIHRFLTAPGYEHPWACLVLTAFGGRVNAVDPAATAVAQRDTILKASYSAGMWTDPAEDDMHERWVREYYRAVHADSGGVPVPGERWAGSYISYPDVDVADPEWNTSGVPWSELYYLDNYARLQDVKRRYDPRDVFRHRLAVRAA